MGHANVPPLVSSALAIPGPSDLIRGARICSNFQETFTKVLRSRGREGETPPRWNRRQGRAGNSTALAQTRENIPWGVSRQSTKPICARCGKLWRSQSRQPNSPICGSGEKNGRISESNMKGVRPIKFSPLSTQTKSIVNGKNGSPFGLRKSLLYVTWRKETLHPRTWLRRIFS